MQVEKDKNLVKLKEKEKFLNELPNYLNALENSTLKTQEILDLKITETINSNRLLDKLPMPLFTLYYSFMCLNNYENFEFDLKILGKEEKIEEFYQEVDYESMNFSQRFLNNLDKDKGKEEGEAESGEEDVVTYKNLKKKKKRRMLIGTESSKPEGLENKKISKFPLYVQFSIKCLKGNINSDYFNEIDVSDSLPISINFYFLPIFNIVTTELITKASEYPISSILSNIFRSPINILNKNRIELERAIGIYIINKQNILMIYQPTKGATITFKI
jgi:hypothetical protein